MGGCFSYCFLLFLLLSSFSFPLLIPFPCILCPCLVHPSSLLSLTYNGFQERMRWGVVFVIIPSYSFSFCLFPFPPTLFSCIVCPCFSSFLPSLPLSVSFICLPLRVRWGCVSSPSLLFLSQCNLRIFLCVQTDMSDLINNSSCPTCSSVPLLQSYREASFL